MTKSIKTLVLVSCLLVGSTIQAGPVAGFIGYWGTKVLGYTAVVTAAVVATVVTGGSGAAATASAVVSAGPAIEAAAVATGAALAITPTP